MTSVKLIGCYMCMRTLDFCNLWHYNRGGISNTVWLGMCFFPALIFLFSLSISLTSLPGSLLSLSQPFFASSPLLSFPRLLLPAAKSFTPRLAQGFVQLRVRLAGWRCNLISKSGDKLPLQLKGRPSFFVYAYRESSLNKPRLSLCRHDTSLMSTHAGLVWPSASPRWCKYSCEWPSPKSQAPFPPALVTDELYLVLQSPSFGWGPGSTRERTQSWLQ